jgi:hypothetical protein
MRHPRLRIADLNSSPGAASGKVTCNPAFARPLKGQRFRRQGARKGYNNRVNAPIPTKPASGIKHPHRQSIYAAEATGLLLMAALLLILTIARYWRYIPWAAR